MSTHDAAKRQSAQLCWDAVAEACLLSLKEGGMAEMLRAMAIFTHGHVAPARTVLPIHDQETAGPRPQARSA